MALPPVNKSAPINFGAYKDVTPKQSVKPKPTLRTLTKNLFVNAPKKIAEKLVLGTKERPSIIGAIPQAIEERSIAPIKQAADRWSQSLGDDPVEIALSFMPTEGGAGAARQVGKKVSTTLFHEAGHAAQSSSDDIVRAVAQFREVLKEAVPVRAAQEALYSAERAKRVAASVAAQTPEGGVAGFLKEKAQLAGELPKINFKPITDKIAPEHVDNLFNAVAQSRYLSQFEKVQARDGLLKMFGKEGGQVPTNSEINLLKQVFPEDVIQGITDLRSGGQKAWDVFVDTLNVPRSVMSTFDLSAPFRQGAFLLGRPVRFTQAFFGMFKQFGSEKAAIAAQESIQSRPTYQLMREAKLALSDINGIVNAREERFASNIAEKIPLLGRGIRASGRAYVGFLNRIRADVFDDMVMKASNMGLDPNRIVASSGRSLAEDTARFVNAATGRGALGALERSANVLNAVFFSPRLMASRFQMLNPVFYMRMDPFVRKQAVKTVLSTATMMATMIGMVKAGYGDDAEVGTDPTSADFLKVKINGQTRIDFTGGATGYMRLAGQLLYGKVTSSISGNVTTLGEGYKPLTEFDVVMRFFQNKENPIASFLINALPLWRGTAKNAIGEPTDIPTEIFDRFIPLIAQDFVEAYKEAGMEGLLLTTPAFFGIGSQTYGDAKDAPEERGGRPTRPTRKTEESSGRPTRPTR